MSWEILEEKELCTACCSETNTGSPTHPNSPISMRIQRRRFVPSSAFSSHPPFPLKHQQSSKEIIKTPLYEMRVLIRFCFRCKTRSWDLLWESQFCRRPLRQLREGLQELLCQMWTQVGPLPANTATGAGRGLGTLQIIHLSLACVVFVSIRDAKCGKIQCQGGASRPVIGTNAVSIETNIPLQEGGKILCRGTHVYLGDDMPDPGLVLAGTKCGDGKVRLWNAPRQWEHHYRHPAKCFVLLFSLEFFIFYTK